MYRKHSLGSSAMTLRHVATYFAVTLIAFIALAAWASSGYAQEEYTFGSFAGPEGGLGRVDGTGSEARFYRPAGIATDSSGNIFIADTFNHVIRKVTAAGVVTTFAGTAGTSGSANGFGTAAQFDAPWGIAIDVSDNLYVADVNNHTIRKVTPAGEVTTFAGEAGSSGSADGNGGAARFNFPYGIDIDSVGNLYVADRYNHTIRHLTSGGDVTTLAGVAGAAGSSDGNGANARFYYPSDIATDGSGNIFIADSLNHTIRKLTTDGDVTTYAGLANTSGSADGPRLDARFFRPYAIAIDGNDDLWIMDVLNHTVRKVSSATGDVTTVAGMVGVDGHADGIADAARFGNSFGIGIDGGGDILIVDSSNHVIREMTTAGSVTTFVGAAAPSGSDDGTGSQARFDRPTGMAVDSQGNLYIADAWNHTIRMSTPAGVVTTFAGLAGVGIR